MTPGELEEALARELAARGVRAVTSAEWTEQAALDMVRENRRRYAHTTRMRVSEGIAGQVALSLAEETGLAPQDIASVLLRASGMLGGLAALHDLSGAQVADFMAIAADDLHQLATTNDATEEGSPCPT